MEGIKDQDAHLNSTQHPLSDEEKELLIRFTERMEEEDSNIEINAKVTASQQLHFTHDEKKKDIFLEEQIPKEYHEFLDVFDKKKADWFPEEQVWDHKIEMKDGFIPKSFKNYNLTLAEQIELGGLYSPPPFLAESARTPSNPRTVLGLS